VTEAEIHELDTAGRRAVFAAGKTIDPSQLAGFDYLGVSLGLPAIADRIAWKTFIKAFHTDTSGTRGWNVRLIQAGLDGPFEPMTRRGKPFTFGHFHVEPGEDALLLDYGAGDNPALDPVRTLRDPVVSVDGTPNLLLGYSLVALGPWTLTTPSWFTLRRLRPTSERIRAHVLGASNR